MRHRLTASVVLPPPVTPPPPLAVYIPAVAAVNPVHSDILIAMATCVCDRQSLFMGVRHAVMPAWFDRRETKIDSAHILPPFYLSLSGSGAVSSKQSWNQSNINQTRMRQSTEAIRNAPKSHSLL